MELREHTFFKGSCKIISYFGKMSCRSLAYIGSSLSQPKRKYQLHSQP